MKKLVRKFGKYNVATFIVMGVGIILPLLTWFLLWLIPSDEDAALLEGFIGLTVLTIGIFAFLIGLVMWVVGFILRKIRSTKRVRPV
jgi:predicted membrane channel-forming protein YqfA (hemolysin III family)